MTQDKHEPELQLVEIEHEKTDNQKIMEVYQKLNDKLDLILEKRNARRRAKTG